MNATEKAEILKSKGYFYTTSNFATTKHRWYQYEKEALRAGNFLAAGATFAAATNAAYALHLQELKEARLGEQIHMTEDEIVAESNQPESPSVASEAPKHCACCGKSLESVPNLSIWKGELYCSYSCLSDKAEKESGLFGQSSPLAIHQPLAELEALRQQVASHAEWASVVKRQWDELLAEKVKLESDLQATQATIVQFGIESEAMRTDFAEKHAKDSRINLNLSEENAKQSRMLDAVIAENTANRIALHEIANNNWNADRMRRTALEAYKAPMQQTASLEALESTEAVTLTEDELRWIAEQWNGKVVVRINPFSVPTKYQHLVRFHHQSDLFTDFTIAPEYDTEINRKAIEARRKQFVEKA